MQVLQPASFLSRRFWVVSLTSGRYGPCHISCGPGRVFVFSKPSNKASPEFRLAVWTVSLTPRVHENAAACKHIKQSAYHVTMLSTSKATVLHSYPLITSVNQFQYVVRYRPPIPRESLLLREGEDNSYLYQGATSGKEYIFSKLSFKYEL